MTKVLDSIQLKATAAKLTALNELYSSDLSSTVILEWPDKIAVNDAQDGDTLGHIEYDGDYDEWVFRPISDNPLAHIKAPTF